MSASTMTVADATRQSLFREAISLERRLFRAERLVLLITVILLAAVAYALFNGAAWRDRQSSLLASAQLEEATRLDEQRDKLTRMNAGSFTPTGAFQNPRNPLWVGLRHAATYAALPATPLAITAIGQSDLNPPYVLVSADSRETFALNEEIENPGNLLAGRFDLAFFVVFLLPLVTVTLSYNLLSAEREQGTLAMTASNPVRLALLLWAKLSYRAAVVLVPLVVFVLGGLLLLGAPILEADGPVRIGGWLLLVTAYVGFWFAVTAAVTVLGRGSAHNALMLVSIWIVLVLVLPTVGSVAVNLSFPVPSRAEMINTLREVKTDSARTADAGAAKYALEHETDRNGGAVSDKDFEAARKRVLSVQLAAEQIASTMAVYDRQIARQRSTIAWLRFLSPAVLMQDALNTIAGTGDERYADFSVQVDAFHQQWQQYFNARVLANEPLTLRDYDAFPRFVYRPGSVATVIAPLVPALIGLLLPMLLLFAYAIRRIERYPITDRA